MSFHPSRQPGGGEDPGYAVCNTVSRRIRLDAEQNRQGQIFRRHRTEPGSEKLCGLLAADQPDRVHPGKGTQFGQQRTGRILVSVDHTHRHLTAHLSGPIFGCAIGGAGSQTGQSGQKTQGGHNEEKRPLASVFSRQERGAFGSSHPRHS